MKSRSPSAARKIAESIRELGRRSCADVIEIGGLLVKAKALLEHGQWRGWLRDEFSWSRQTADNFIAVNKTFGSVKMPTIGFLDVTALYELSRRSTPSVALTTVLEKLEGGAAPSVADVRRIIRDAKPKPTPDVLPPEKPPPSIRDAAFAEKFRVAVTALRALCSKPSAVFVGAVSTADLNMLANFLKQVVERQTAGDRQDLREEIHGNENGSPAKAVRL